MALLESQIVVRGETHHRHEREAVDFLIDCLPPTDPYRLWALVELVDGQGRRYDVDALVVGYHAVYLIEIKSHPAVRGNAVDWVFEVSSGAKSTRENPMKLVSHKARVLASLLDRRYKGQGRRPFVEPLVFLSHPEVKADLDEGGRFGVVTRATLARALTHGDVPGGTERVQRWPRIDKPTSRAVLDATRAIGLVASKGAQKLGELQVGKLIEEGPGYQDRLAVHETLKVERRIRAYLTPEATTAERRDLLNRAARREATVLTSLSDHRRILRLLDFLPSGLGEAPNLVFEHPPETARLDTFIRSNPALPYTQRIDLIVQIGEALAYCHRKKILHRNLHPGSVLVQRLPKDDHGENSLEVRLYNFQLATQGSEGTLHISTLTADPDMVYRAPELIENPASATEASDVFSLGCVAFFVLTGQAPGSDLADRKQHLDAAGGHLSLTRVSDKLALVRLGSSDSEFASLDEVIAYATDVAAQTGRCDKVLDWTELLLAEATQPAASTTAKDPLHATKGDRLDDGFVVERLLGTGSTSRVLLVKNQEDLFALKVPLHEEAEQRLTAEAEVLGRLRSEAIVTSHGLRTFQGRRCLLLSYAGDTLADQLAESGPPSLDFANRWGDGLLRALEVLELHGVQHRDIKPANLGVTDRAKKRAQSLVLFDFSLSPADSRSIASGTPVYRDPFLVDRKNWDGAADRWSAAMTLYEMLTGVRAQFGKGDEAASATDQEITLEPERFEASARKRLESFFRHAFARDVGKRFASAEVMRTQWISCFATITETEPRTTAPLNRAELLKTIEPSASIDALPLSSSAKNALDRAGLITVRDLIGLPDNRLSVMRGVARATAEEILRLGREYRAVRPEVNPAAEDAFRPDFRGIPSPLADLVHWPIELIIAFADAGLGHLGAIALAPQKQVERLLERHPGASNHLAAAFEAASAVDGAAITIESWLGKLFAGKRAGKKNDQALTYARAVLGLDELPGLARPAESRAVAKHFGVTPQNVYLSVKRLYEQWSERPDLESLLQPVRGLVEGLGGAAPLEVAARALPAVIPHAAAEVGDGNAVIRAEALLRIASELSPGLTLGRFVVKGDAAQRLWIATGQTELAVARALGREADAIAAEAVLPSAEEVRERLLKVTKDTPLARLPIERLLRVAAEASAVAAVSARLELYPRGMAAERAVLLCATYLSGAEPTEEEVHQVLRQRYPDALPAPPRPELDELLKKLELSWDKEAQRYRRGDGRSVVSSATHVLSSSTSHSAQPRPKLPPAEELERMEFDEKIRLAVEKRYLRIIEVVAPYLHDAVTNLETRTGQPAVSLDAEIWKLLNRLIHENGVSLPVVFETDRQGPRSEHWPLLRELVRRAAEELVTHLLEQRTPLVLVHLGILARYDLESVLKRLTDAAAENDTRAIFLVNAVHDLAGTTQPISGGFSQLFIPTTSSAQVLRAPDKWLKHGSRGAA